jgi:protein-S-isoprenylcysteine O-methyltransferase Ste14
MIPEFTIGIWNAWLLMLVFLLQPLILLVVDRLVGTGEIYKKLGGEPPDAFHQRLGRIATLLIYVMVVFSVFLPLKTGTAWLYTGLLIYGVGLAIFLDAIVIAARARLGELFVGGIYRYSRHPLYLSSLIILLGVSLATASWIFLFLSAVYIYMTFSFVPAEEQDCLASFGEAYQAYMAVTPRWIGLPRVNKN